VNDAADSSTDDDPEQRLVAQTFGDIDAGRTTLDEAIREHPELAGRLREMESLRRLLQHTQKAVAPNLPDFLGEFRIVGVIGEGGMGVVYRAFHDRLKRHVAVKAIRPTKVSASASARFEREQTALARLHQTCIVPIYTAGVDGSDHYFVMPYIEGASLQQVLERLRNRNGSKDASESTLFHMVSGARREASATASTASLHRTDANGTNRKGADEKPKRRVESPAYWRSCATVIAEAAEAIEHAHRREVFHRDLKPNNIMLSDDGRIWIIDFGLASFHRGEHPAEEAAAPESPGITHAALGTWSYMAPEQFSLTADARSDVWGLGVTLYELLTLQRAFAHRSPSDPKLAFEAEPPPPPREMEPSIPADLAAICWKAMRKDPNDRYQTAAALALDLRRFLRGEEVGARPRPNREKLFRWVGRNRALAALLATLAVAVPTIIGLQYQAGVKAQAQLAEQRRQFMLRELDDLIDGEKMSGWSKEALKKIGDAAAVRKESALRDAAVEVFVGLDFEHVGAQPGFGASSAVYSSDGKRLLLGGTDKRGDRASTPTRVWTLGEPTPKPGKAEGGGLVAFRRDGTPIQLVADSRGRLRIVHVITGETLREFKGLAGADRVRQPTTAISKDGEQVAASFADEGVTLCWNGGAPPIRLAVGATALTFTDDGKLVATGSRSGSASIWATTDGARVSEHSYLGHTIQTIAFDHGATRFGERLVGRLAMGSFGRISVVDLAGGRLACDFENRAFDCEQLAFSPDDLLIAADGVLFDSAQGRSLMVVSRDQEVFAFSPDGGEVCTATASGFAEPGVYRLSLLRSPAARLLHGALTPAGRLAVSRDCKTMASVSRDWRIGVWNLESGKLLRTLHLEEGLYADNAAVALSDDGSKVAAASGRFVGLWDVSTGALNREWRLPPAIGNEIAFRHDGKVRIVRLEQLSMRDFPVSPFRFPEHPRVVRVRDLSAHDSEAPVCTINDFARGTIGRALSPDGSRLLLDGRAADGSRCVRLYNAATGRAIQRYEVEDKREYHSLRVDPTGSAMSFQSDGSDRPSLLISPTDGNEIGRIHSTDALFKRGELTVTTDGKYMAVARSDGSKLFRLPRFAGQIAEFSSDGRFLVFDTKFGSIGAIDIPAMLKAFDDLGLN
jgi:serine/threonine protein kinase/WD40 repeat protein